MNRFNIKKLARGTEVGPQRVYVYDVDSGEELAGGFAWWGRRESGIWRGKRWTDTTMGVDCVDLRSKEAFTLTAESFPGRRIAVKIWYGPEETEWCALVNRARGWRGNEASLEVTERVTLGIAERMRRVLSRAS